jgi:uncharacterized protein YidB (DUF937 family)
MGILDEQGKNLGGLGGASAGGPAAGGGGQGALVQALMGLLAGGGLQQLVSSFQQKGLGDVVGSWISTGQNRPISPDQVQQALGPDQLGRLSQQTGLDTGALAGQLSSLLPSLVDRLTPDGNVPDAGALQDRLGGLLKGLF